MKKYLFALLLIGSTMPLLAQKFHAPFSLAAVKDADVKLKDGTELKDMRVKKAKAKKGIVTMIGLGNDDTPTRKIKVSEISTLYGHPKGLMKVSTVANQSITQASKTDHGSLGKDELVYEHVVMPKGTKVKETLLQLLNPEFASNVKVYGDPLMKKSAGFAGGLVGSELKSFYVKVGENPVVYVKNKSAYRKLFNLLYKDCPDFEAVVLAAHKDIDVLDLGKHVILYDEKCPK